MIKEKSTLEQLLAIAVDTKQDVTPLCIQYIKYTEIYQLPKYYALGLMEVEHRRNYNKKVIL